MARKAGLLFLFAIITLLITVAWLSRPRQYYNDVVSDEEYIQIASEIDAAQAFLEHFPEAEIYVDRSARLAVDFRVDRVPMTTATQSWEGIRLRIFINPRTRRAADFFIQCNDDSGETHFVEADLIEYLKRYVKNQSCP